MTRVARRGLGVDYGSWVGSNSILGWRMHFCDPQSYRVRGVSSKGVLGHQKPLLNSRTLSRFRPILARRFVENCLGVEISLIIPCMLPFLIDQRVVPRSFVTSDPASTSVSDSQPPESPLPIMQAAEESPSKSVGDYADLRANTPKRDAKRKSTSKAFG